MVATTRSKLDAPPLFAAPLSGDAEFPYKRELGKLESVEELVNTLR